MYGALIEAKYTPTITGKVCMRYTSTTLYCDWI